jgi:hypothetical protein
MIEASNGAGSGMQRIIDVVKADKEYETLDVDRITHEYDKRARLLFIVETLMNTS